MTDHPHPDTQSTTSAGSLQAALLSRTERLLGTSAMQRLAQVRVILFGVGGVGSWCAESLVRSGIVHLTIVDSDCVASSNCNRQLMATSSTIGRPKVEALRERLLDINPEADITALQQPYNSETAPSFGLDGYDYVIDAIDSLQHKAALILQVTALKGVTLYSSMGAALRLDPTQVRTAEFWRVQGDGLARALRNRFKRDKTMPRRKFTCVYSEEQPLPNLGTTTAETPDSWSATKAQINGSMMPVTATFGLTLSSLVLRDIRGKE